MQIQRAVPSGVVPMRARVAARAAPARAAASDAGEGQRFRNEVVKAVAWAREALWALEAAGQAYNAGSGDQERFDRALTEFEARRADLRALEAAGKRLDAPFWQPWGFRSRRVLVETGAQDLLDYRPPSLVGPSPSQAAVFDVRLENARRAAEAAVDVEPALRALLADARTVDQVDRLLAVARAGYRWKPDTPTIRDELPRQFFATAHARRAELAPPADYAERVAALARAADDSVDVSAGLRELLAQARSAEDVDALLAAARVGYRWKPDSGDHRLRFPRELFAAAHERRERIAPSRGFEARLASLERAATDGVDVSAALRSLLGYARTSAEVDRLVAVGRKGYSYAPDWTSHRLSLDRGVFEAAHTRRLQLALEELAKDVGRPDRVRFALQPLPTFDTPEAYRNYAVKAAAYALVGIRELREARAAHAAGEVPARVVIQAEEDLRLALATVAALRAASSAGFDARTFWDEHAIEASAHGLLD